MRTASERIEGAFQLIYGVFDELKRGDGVKWGDSIRETIDEAIRTYKRKVEKMDEEVEKLVRNTVLLVPTYTTDTNQTGFILAHKSSKSVERR